MRLKPLEVIDFTQIDSSRFGEILSKNPMILKPFFAFCGIGSRAVARDLGISGLDTYKPKLSISQAHQIAKYLIEWLPNVVAIDVLAEIDRVEFADTQKRSLKGSWEKTVRRVVSDESGLEFTKRRFTVPLRKGQPEVFEIDLAYPKLGGIQVAIDVKRIEARQDYQKRSDEIVNKASALKKLYPAAKFAAFIYYPFSPHEVRGRLESSEINETVFAGEDDFSIRVAVKQLIQAFGLSNLQRKLGVQRTIRKPR